MKRLKGYCIVSILALTLWSIQAHTNIVLAQNQSASSSAASSEARSDEVNHEVQLYLLAASNESGERSNLPQSMDAVIKQLKSSLPFTHYRLALTFINRVKDTGSFEVSGSGGSPLVTTPSNPNTPTIFSFSLSNVRLTADANNQPFVKIGKFRFGLKVPILTGTTRTESSSAGYPVFQYQDTGITTELSVREGTPTIVGTLMANRPDQLFVLVVSVKRTSSR